MSTGSSNKLDQEQTHYIGIDVGTGSARACIMNGKGDIVGLASENIDLWQPETGFYVCPIHFRIFDLKTSLSVKLIGLTGAINDKYLEMYLLIHQTRHVSKNHRPE